MRHARDEDEAFRVRAQNVLSLVLTASVGVWVLLSLQRGEVDNAVRYLPTAMVCVLPLALHAAGALLPSRVITLAYLPAMLLVMVGLGYSERGAIAFLPCVILLPVLFLARPKPRWLLPGGILLGVASSVATYVGTRYSQLPEVPVAQRPTVLATDAFLGVLFSSILVSVLMWRKERLVDALQSSIRERDRAAEARESLLSVVSHELRTPASMALGLLEGVLDTHELRPETRARLEEAKGAVATEVDVLGDLIDLVALRSGRLRVASRRFRLSAALERACAEATRRAAERKLDFSMEVDAGDPVSVGDSDRVAQIIRHLVDNAVRFTRAGEVRVIAERRGEQVSLQVRDTGPGMDEATLHRVFEAFEQADEGLDRAGEGLGLGLTLVRALVARLDGEFLVESEVGAGTTVTVVLHLPVAPRLVAPGEKLEGAKVLVVDDLALNRRILRRQLERVGAHVVEAEDGERAVELWRLEKPDLILMDMQMPGVDGPESTRRIRALGGDVPIVAVTANVSPGAASTCRAAGMDGYVAKPVQMDRIIAVLQDEEAPLGGR